MLCKEGTWRTTYSSPQIIWRPITPPPKMSIKTRMISQWSTKENIGAKRGGNERKCVCTSQNQPNTDWSWRPHKSNVENPWWQWYNVPIQMYSSLPCKNRTRNSSREISSGYFFVNKQWNLPIHGTHYHNGCVPFHQRSRPVTSEFCGGIELGNTRNSSAAGCGWLSPENLEKN